MFYLVMLNFFFQSDAGVSNKNKHNYNVNANLMRCNNVITIIYWDIDVAKEQKGWKRGCRKRTSKEVVNEYGMKTHLKEVHHCCAGIVME